MLTFFHPRRSLFDNIFAGDSFFDDHFNFPFLDVVPSSPRYTSQGPSVSSRALEDAIEIELEVPRFRMADIKVEGDRSRGRLVITGKRGISDERSVHSSGTSTPAFCRVFSVNPKIFDLDKVSTKLEDGVLTVRLPYLPPPKKEQPSLPVEEGEQPDDTHILVQRTPSAQPSTSAVVQSTGGSPFAHFHWPPKMDVIPKSDSSPLTFQVTMPEGVSDPTISLRLLKDSLLVVDVIYTTRSENDLGFSEQRGSFSRTFSLPPGTSRDAVSAQFENGKLLITVKN